MDILIDDIQKIKCDLNEECEKCTTARKTFILHQLMLATLNYEEKVKELMTS